MGFTGDYKTAHNATYCCPSCGNAEGMGIDDPRSNLTEFNYDFLSEKLTCNTCGSDKCFCEFSPEEG